jgi:HEAT repeat protein
MRKKQDKAPAIDVLIEQMRSPDQKARARVVRTFHGKLQGRFSAKRRPDLVQPLTELFYATSQASVRSACVAALTELAEDGTAPTPLFDALSDSDAGVILAGIFALQYFPDPRAVEPLCKFIESGANLLFNESAMSQLGQAAVKKQLGHFDLGRMV